MIGLITARALAYNTRGIITDRLVDKARQKDRDVKTINHLTSVLLNM